MMELPEGWATAALGEIVQSSLIGIDRGRSRQRAIPPGSPYVRMNCITNDGRVRFSNLTFVDVNPEERRHFSLRTGDILFNTRNSRELVGKIGLVIDPPPEAVFNNNIMRLRVNNLSTCAVSRRSNADPGISIEA
ncbi:MAG: restriction endonuclease subunit S [Acidimicrobiales bacterium]